MSMTTKLNCECLEFVTALEELSSLCSLCGLVFAGQSYEIRMLDNRKIGELPEITGKMVKVRLYIMYVVFHKHTW